MTTATSPRLSWRQLWRHRVRPLGRRAQFPVLATLALLAFALGCIGFASREKGLDGPYRAFQLFVLEWSYDGLDRPLPLTVAVARFLAPMVAAWAIVAAVLSLFRDRLQLARVRLLARSHVVVVGLGAKGSMLVGALHDAGLPVVGIERHQDSPRVESCRARGIMVVPGDATDPRVLKRARVDRARRLVVLCGDDSLSVNTMFAAAALDRPRRAGVLSALVHLDDLGLRRRFAAEALLIRERLGLRPFFFNTVDLAASQLGEQELGASDCRRPSEVVQPHVLIVGLGELTERLVLHLARSWQDCEHRAVERLRITLGGLGAEALSKTLAKQHPKLGRLCELAAREVDVTATELDCADLLLDRAGRFAVTKAYVNLASEAEGLAAALGLHAVGTARATPIVLIVRDETRGVATALDAGGGLRGIRPFGLLSRTLTPGLLALDAYEMLARASHSHYVRSQRERGESAVENPSLVPWERLPESLKDSNRRFADGIGSKLDQYSCALLPAPLARADANGFSFTDDEVEELATLEHDRWCRDLQEDGWRKGPRKDPERKLHSSLVPWRELSDVDRDKDRDLVRALPQMLARVGFEIYRAPQ